MYSNIPINVRSLKSLQHNVNVNNPKKLETRRILKSENIKVDIPCLDKCIIKRHDIGFEEAAKELIKNGHMLRRE